MTPVAAPRWPRRLGRVHWGGLATLYRREMRRFFKEWVETIAASGFATVMYLAVFAFALGPDRETPEGAAVMAFILPGLVLFSILTRAGETTVSSIVYDKLEGIISDILTAPLTPGEIAAAYALAGASAGLITGLPVVLAALLFFDLTIADPLLFLLFAVGGALMLSLIGIMAGIWAMKWDHVSAFFGFFFIPLTFLSGLFAPIEALPGPLTLIVQANPAFYVIDGFRAATLGIHSVPVGRSVAVMLVLIIALWAGCGAILRSGWRLKS